MQTIAKATLDQFQNALGLNRRRGGIRPAQIQDSLNPTFGIVSKVMNTFWATHTPTKDIDTFEEKLGKFFSGRAKVRLCYAATPERPAVAAGGYIVLDGELLGLHNIEKGKGRWMLDRAIEDGATHLDCFDVAPVRQLYESRGFRVVRREANDNPGEPDVLWMELHAS